MNREQIDRTTVVLVEPSLPENVGAVARAMKNMGFRRLRIVAPSGYIEHLSHKARRMSAGSEEILEKAGTWATLGEALADLQIVVGCTARKGKGRRPVLGPRDVPPWLDGYGPGTEAAIVFGREDRGLENHELDLCNVLVTIPTAPEHTSPNLAQAVLLVCYEIARPLPALPLKRPLLEAHVTSGQMEELFQHARDVLLRIGFLETQNPERILRVLRRIAGRAGLDPREVSILRGILRKMNWYAGVHDPDR